MITGQIDELKKNKWLSSIESINNIVNIIDNTDFSKLEDGTYNVDEKGLFYVLATYNTSSVMEDKPAEVHRKNIDFQYIIYGEEKIGYSEISNSKISREIYDDGTDIELFSKIENEGFFILKKGMYAVFFPDDVHRPGLSNKETRGVRKAIFKVPV